MNMETLWVIYDVKTCKSRDVNPIGIVDCHVRLCNQG